MKLCVTLSSAQCVSSYTLRHVFVHIIQKTHYIKTVKKTLTFYIHWPKKGTSRLKKKVNVRKTEDG
jgi:hypothetical protein